MPPRKRPIKIPELSAEEQRDWADAVEGTKAYADKAERPSAEALMEQAEEAARKPSIEARPLRVNAPPKPSADLLPLEVGMEHSIDKRTAGRIRKGKQPIDAVLDLHGLKQAEACERFYGFIQSHQAAGHRTVLVITGQGRRSEEGPVLQQALPRWANEPLLRPFIVALDYATPAQGGKGAYVIYLRRTR